jgi:hypothetical protein
MINKRNLICVKNKENLDLGHLLLYEPYKNILNNFKELCTDINAKSFDPVAQVFDGLLSVPPEIKEYYEALLGVSSYYQHSQGGRGKYIEKKIASSFESCTLDIKLSKIPHWLIYPSLHKKQGLFTQNGLSREEKEKLRTIEWNWIGEKDVITDVGSIIPEEHSIVLVEIKNRVDSGGTAARREIWTSEKFGIYLDYLINNKKLFKKNDKEFSLVELLEYFNIYNFEIYIGILFDTNNNPATIQSDRINGFYSSSKTGFEYLKNIIRQNTSVYIVNEDSDNLFLELGLTYSQLKVKIGALYGDDITFKLFRHRLPVSDLLLLKYDDIWLSQLISIDERSILLKYKNNFTKTFIDLLDRDNELREMYNDLIKSECDEAKLRDIINYLLSEYCSKFKDKLLPHSNDKSTYLADIVQFLCAVDA